LILIFSSCVEKTKTESYYPSKGDFIDNSNMSQISLDSLKNFNELIDEIDKIVCADKIPVVNFENGKSKFKIIPVNICSLKRGIECFKPFSMSITSDSIKIDEVKRVGIEELPMALELNLLNKGKNLIYGDTPEKTIFEIQVDSIYDIKKTRDLLIRIANSYNELNKNNMDSLYLKIRFTKFEGYTSPPRLFME